MNKTVTGVIRCPDDQKPDDERDICLQVMDVRQPHFKKVLSEIRVQDVLLPYKYEINFEMDDEDALYGYEMQIRINTRNDLSHMNLKAVPLIVDGKLILNVDIDVKCILKP
jgi:hypothetical protein